MNLAPCGYLYKSRFLYLFWLPIVPVWNYGKFGVEMAEKTTEAPKDDKSKEAPKAPEPVDKLTGQTSAAESAKSLSLDATRPDISKTSITQADTAKPTLEAKPHTAGADSPEKAQVQMLLGKMELVVDAPAKSTEAPAKIESSTKVELKPEAITKAVIDIQDAVNNKNLFGWGFNVVDQEKIRNIIEPMTAKDRQAIEAAYEKQTGHKLRDDLKQRLGADSSDYLKLESILNRQDGKSDEAGQIKTDLSKITQSMDNLRSRTGMLYKFGEAMSPMMSSIDSINNANDLTAKNNAEADIRKSIGSLTSAQIQDLNQTYQKNYGVDLATAINSNPNVSAETKAALEILLKGIDSRTGNSAESAKNAEALADIGLNSKNIDIFKDAMQSAAPEVRQDWFEKNNNSEKLANTFRGDDLELANSYVVRGSANLGHLVEGNDHWYHTNKDEITRLMTTQASDADRDQFSRGRFYALMMEANQNSKFSVSPEQQADIDFYKRIHDGLKSAGNDREVAQWEAKLMKSPEVVSQLLDARYDGGFLGWGANTDKNKLYSAVDNLSEADWNRIRANPQMELFNINKALTTFADSNKDDIMARLIAKIQQPSYDLAQKVGNRSVDEVFAANQNNPGAKIERLLKMSDQEKADYLNNTRGAADKLNQLIESQTKPGIEKLEAQRILGEIKAGKSPDKVDAALLSALKGEKPTDTVKKIEDALKENPSLLIGSSKSQSDQDLQKTLRQALDQAVEKAGFGDQFYATPTGGAYVPGRQNEFADQIFKTGSMPVQLKLSMDAGDAVARFNDIANATTEEKQLLLQNPPSSDAARKLQSQVFRNEDEKPILLNALTQGKLTDADLFKAFASGANVDPEQLKATLNKMSLDDRQNLANEYFIKYNSLISQVIDKVPDVDKYRFRELLSPTDVNVRQVALDTREEGARHTSAFDPVLNQFWDKSQLGSVEAQSKLDGFVKEHAAEIDKLTPEQKKQFYDAVANYQSALKNYIDSKGAFSEAFVDSAITVAAVGGAFFTGGTSLSLLMAIGAGGAAFRVATMKAIEGSDFKDTPENYARQAFKGFLTAAAGFASPQALGLNGIIKIGEGPAAAAAESVFTRLARQGVAFKDASAATQEIIAKELAGVSRQSAIIGGQQTDAIIQKITAEVLKDSASPTEKALLEQTLRSELKANVITGLRQKLLNEAESYILNISTASGINAGTEFAATAVGLEDPNTLWQRMGSSAISGLVGASVFHLAFKGIGATFQGAKAILGKDSQGLFAGEGTVVRRQDGSDYVVKSGEQYRFQQGDKVVENLSVDAPPARAADLGADGRPVDTAKIAGIKDKFEIADGGTDIARNLVANELKQISGGIDAAGKIESVYDKLMSNQALSDMQKERVLQLLSSVREHYTAYRGADGKLIADQEVNWIHTQGELAKVIDSANANKLSGEETENALIASMFSDSMKLTDTAITKGNFTTHHLDGALAAAEMLSLRGFSPERINAITQAIREHQIAPPEFMGFIYQTTIARNLKTQLDSGAITQARYDEMKKVLDDMTVVSDGMPRIKQIADINNTSIVKNGNGEWEVAFTPEQRELMKLSGTDHWYVPHDPRLLSDGKTPDPEFTNLPKDEQARRLSQYRSSRALIDGDGIDNYATVGGASKIVKIRGPETFFQDKTVWDSVKSIDKSYDDAFKVLTPEGQRLAKESLEIRNVILDDAQSGIRSKMDEWLRAQGKDPSKGDVPFYNAELKYPQALNAAEQTRLKELQAIRPQNAASKAQIDAEIRSLKYKGLNDQQIKDYEFAKQIRDQMVDFMRRAHRTDGMPSTEYRPLEQSIYPEYFNQVSDPRSNLWEMPKPNGETLTLQDGSQKYFWSRDGRNGSVISKPDGTKILTDDLALTTKTYDAQGKITSVRSGGIEPETTSFSYDDKGAIQKIQRGDWQTLSTSDGGKTWQEVEFDPKTNEYITAKTDRIPIAVDGDGTIRYESPEVPVMSKTLYENTIVRFQRDGRVDYISADYFVESSRLKNMIQEKFPPGARTERARQLLQEFEENASARGLDESEKARFYLQLNRLLSDAPKAIISLPDRVNLAEQVLNHAAHPTTVDQGMNKTCNVATCENRIYTRNPSATAQAVADAAIYGRYTTSTGNTVDLMALDNGVKPDFEAWKSLRLQEQGADAVKIDGARDWASQLAERIMANERWLAAPSLYVSGDRVVSTDIVVHDASGKVLGKLDDISSVKELYSKDGELLKKLPESNEFYSKDGKPVNLDASQLVYSRSGTLRGFVAPNKIEPLYNVNGQLIETPQTLVGTSVLQGYDKNGNLLISQVQPLYDKTIDGQERVFFDQYGKKITLKKESGTKDEYNDPNITTASLHRITEAITGKVEEPFVIEGNTESKTYKNLIQVASEQDFETALINMGETANFPGILFVHTAFEPFNQKFSRAADYAGGFHVVNVQGFDPKTKQVFVSNQWGSASDFEEYGLPLSVVFKAMHNSKTVPEK